MRRHPTHLAFTLIELLLVLVVISAALAIAAPSLGNWGRGQRLRDAGDEFLATARWARAQSIATGRIYRLNVDAREGRYWVTAQEGLEFVPIDADFARENTVPANATLELTAAASRPAEFVSFFPNGRTTAAHVTLADDRGAIHIVCQTPAEGFRILKPGELIQ